MRRVQGLARDCKDPQRTEVARDVGLGSALGQKQIATAARPCEVVDVGEPCPARGEIRASENLGLETGDPAVFILIGNDVAVPIPECRPEAEAVVLIGEPRARTEGVHAEFANELLKESLM